MRIDDKTLNKLIAIGSTLLIILLIFDLYILMKKPEADIKAIEEDRVSEKIIEQKYETSQRKDMFGEVVYNHWDHMPLTYFIYENECPGHKTESIRRGMDIIENLTHDRVKYEEWDNESADILIHCMDLEQEIEKYKKCKLLRYSYPKRRKDISVFKEGHLDFEEEAVYSLKEVEDSGEETVFELCYMNKSEITFSEKIIHKLDVYGEARTYIEDRIIKNSTIIHYFHSKVSCKNYPTLEIKELLFSMGFDSNYQRDDILNPLLDGCASAKRLNNKYISCLNHIYSNAKAKTISECVGISFMPSA